ncbi:hypothetical protein [Clostridioides sp. ZZV15-6597]|uniref:hypothetical protein n=1 Tax=Clostridioides sp. ZZV15-6597 TaxID=2811500 RepID=UPI001D10E7CD|nr:hypothetical protein [Clostridioides sp. ZZV15-6597]
MKYKIISFLIISLFVLSSSFCVSADGLNELNGIGESEQNNADNNSNNITNSDLDDNDSITSNNIKNYYDNYYNNNNSSDVPDYTDNKNKSSINAISRLFSGISEEDINNANIILGPVLKIARKVIAILSCVAVIATGFTTGVDLLFISAPFTRDFLYKKASSGGNGMYGMGGTQDSTSKRWISDVALSCVVEFESSQNNNQNYPGMQQQPRKKDMIFSYIKRRSVHIVLFTMSLVLFSTTVLNDFGFRILDFILKYSYSFINSI